MFGGFLVTDTAYYVLGQTRTNITYPNPTELGWLSVFDTFGILIKQRILGNREREYWIMRRTSKLSQNGEIISSGYNEGQKSSFLLWLNQNGDKLKYHEFYPDSSNAIFFRGYDFYIYPNKSYYLINYESNISFLGPVLIYVDSNGNEIWRKKYPIPNSFRSFGFVLFRRGNELIIAGKVERGQFGHGTWRSQFWIAGIDSLGNKKWEFFSPTNRLLSPASYRLAQNGDLLICGWEGFVHDPSPPIINYRYKGMVARFDVANQQLRWVKSIGIPYFSSFGDIVEKDNGELIAWGNGVMDTPWDSLFDVGWLAAFSAHGDSLWERSVLHYRADTVERSLAYYPGSIKILPNKQLLMTGSVEDYDPNSPDYGFWGWLVRTDSNGCQTADCRTVGIAPTIQSDMHIGTFPNPVDSWMVVHSSKALQAEGRLRLYDLQGKLLAEQYLAPASQEWMLEMGAYPPGIYLVEMEVGGKRWSRKVMKR